MRETHRAIRKLTQEMARSICNHPEVEELMQTLSAQLKTVKGKKSYGYLPKSVKKTVDEVVDKLEELPEVRECYEQWCALQSEVDSYYHDKPERRKHCPRRKSSGRSRTPSSRRRSVSVWGKSLSRMRTWPATTRRSGCVVSLMPAGNCGRSSGTSTFLWQTDGAVEELEWLAERGDTHAQYLMGQLYRDGPLLIPDSQKAKDWFTQAQSMVCQRHSMLWANCFSLPIWKCGTRTRASAG